MLVIGNRRKSTQTEIQPNQQTKMRNCCCKCCQRNAGRIAGLLGLSSTIAMIISLVEDEIWTQSGINSNGEESEIKCGWNTIYTADRGTQDYSYYDRFGDGGWCDEEEEAGKLWLIFSLGSLMLGLTGTFVSICLTHLKCVSITAYIIAFISGVAALVFARDLLDSGNKAESLQFCGYLSEGYNVCEYEGTEGISQYIQAIAVPLYLIAALILPCYKPIYAINPLGIQQPRGIRDRIRTISRSIRTSVERYDISFIMFTISNSNITQKIKINNTQHEPN